MTWSNVLLGEVVQLNYGKPLPNSVRSENGSVPVFGANGVKAYSARSLHQGPSVIIGRKGSAGEVNRADGPFWPLDVTYFTTHDDGRLDFNYLEYALRQMDLPSLAKGIKPGINRNEVYALPLPLPPLEEQKRIVAVLDQAFAALDHAHVLAEDNLADAEELFPSILGQAFEPSAPWPMKTVSDLIDEQIIDRPIDGNHGETHPKKADFVMKGVPFIMASDLKDGIVDQEECYFITREQADALRKGFAKDGDVLLSHKGTIGRAAILKTSLDYVMLTPQVTYYRVIDEGRLDREFLYHCFQSSAFLKEIRDIAGIGATRAYIGITRQQELEIPLPSLEVQHTMVARFKSVRLGIASSVELYRSQVTDLVKLRQSLLRKAFAGELTLAHA